MFESAFTNFNHQTANILQRALPKRGRHNLISNSKFGIAYLHFGIHWEWCWAIVLFPIYQFEFYVVQIDTIFHEMNENIGITLSTTTIALVFNQIQKAENFVPKTKKNGNNWCHINKPHGKWMEFKLVLDNKIPENSL